MEVSTYTKEELEEFMDTVKAVILVDLVNKGLLEGDIADMYAEQTTVILKNKSFFRTITDRWKKEPTSPNYYLLAVSNPTLVKRKDTEDDEDKSKILKLVPKDDKDKKDR